MATQKYVNTDATGMGEYSDVPGKRSAVVGGTQSKAGAGRGFVNPPRPDDSSSERSPAVQEAIQEMQDAKSRKKISEMGFKKGGKVSSASSRADGCAVKGKTKGRIV